VSKENKKRSVAHITVWPGIDAEGPYMGVYLVEHGGMTRSFYRSPMDKAKAMRMMQALLDTINATEGE
jgi:hypothetical protein